MVIISEDVVNAGKRVQELDKGDDDERRTQPVMRSGRSRRILGGTHRVPHGTERIKVAVTLGSTAAHLRFVT
jgi:hypothetical protein